MKGIYYEKCVVLIYQPIRDPHPHIQHAYTYPHAVGVTANVVVWLKILTESEEMSVFGMLHDNVMVNNTQIK